MTDGARPKPASPLQDALALVVDDVAVNISVLGIILRKAGCRVVSAASAAQALERIRASRPDVILLDIVMPDEDGYALCTRLKAMPECAAIPVLFLSALTEPLDKVRAFTVGGADYVSKPFHAEEVLARVAHQLKLAQLQQALEREKAELQRSNAELRRAQEQAQAVFGAFIDLLPGHLLDEKYRIYERLGSGGFGVVYRATQLALDREVAVKLFRPHSRMDPKQSLRRFMQEGMLAGRIQHPNAVQVIDAGVAKEGIAYLVMELLRGHTLSDEMLRDRQVPLPRASVLVTQIAAALVHAHAAGVVHRDIKPDNIFLHCDSSSGLETLKVLDFGIAEDTTERERRSIVPQNREVLANHGLGRGTSERRSR